jgi:hypothetical protein
MIIGVTGTRNGMNPRQNIIAWDFLNKQFYIAQKTEIIRPEFHHGDCKGVDEQTAAMAMKIGYYVVCHPPFNKLLRAFQISNISRHEYSYLRRNRNIVDECHMLLVIPKEQSPQLKGGTWYTHDYALKTNKPVFVVYPKEEWIYVS